MHVDCWHITGGGFHFGAHGLDQEATLSAFPSDSLFAALLARLGEAGGSPAAEGFLAPFQAGPPPFRLTSTFPFAGEVRFFPLPLSALRTAAGQAARVTAVQMKDLKKVRYLSEKLFRRILAGEPLADLYPAAYKLQGRSVLVDPAEKTRLPDELQKSEGAAVWAEEVRPRVTLGRSVQNSALYFTGRVCYAAGCGLWFGVAWAQPDEALPGRLAGLLSDLAVAGLGAERSAGYGACTIAPSGVMDLPGPDGAAWVTLSRYLPRPDEMPALTWGGAAYSLKHVGGWVDSAHRRGQRRRPVNLLAEGSVLGPLAQPPAGQVLDVRPLYRPLDAQTPGPIDILSHAVYRSGLAFPVAIQTGWKEDV